MRVFLLTILSLLLLAETNGQTMDPDLKLLNRINSQEEKASDPFFRFLSGTITPVSFGVPVGLLSAGYAQKDDQLIRYGWKSGASLALTGILTTGIKISAKRERPYVAHGDLILKKAKTGPFSFPSGHTSTAFATATTLSLAFPKWYVIGPSFLWAGAVAYSRMYLGVHFPSDIWGGMVIGVGSSLLIWGIDRIGR